MTESYSEPVLQLLTLGETDLNAEQDYLKLGFTREHIPELIRLVEDEVLRNLPVLKNGDSQPQTYAQVHAWRALAQLEAVEAIPVFLGLLHFVDDDEDDFVDAEIPAMIGKLGEPAIEPCRAYLVDTGNGLYARSMAGSALAEIALQHPEHRAACVQALMSSLEDYENDDETVNAFTLSYLSDLKAVEAAPLAEEIFAAKCVDTSIAGDFEDYQMRVGMLEERLTPRSPLKLPAGLSSWSSEPNESGFMRKPQLSKEKEKKEKAKAKQAKKARKKNKKR